MNIRAIAKTSRTAQKKPRRERPVSAEPQLDAAEPTVALFPPAAARPSRPAAKPRAPGQAEPRVVGFGDDLPAFLRRAPRVLARA